MIYFYKNAYTIIVYDNVSKNNIRKSTLAYQEED